MPNQQPSNSEYNITNNIGYGFPQEGGPKKAVTDPYQVINKLTEETGGYLPLFKTLVSIPWPALLKRAPLLVQMAEALLLGTTHGRKDGSSPDENASLRERISALEAHDRRDAELVKQLAEQVEALTLTVRIMAARQKAVLWMAGLGFGLLFAALVAGLLLRP